MDLHIMCRKCLKYFEVKEKVKDRRALAEKLGEYFTMKCSRCGHEREFHVNDVKASAGIKTFLFFFAIGLSMMALITVFAWNRGYITTIGFVLGAGFIAAGLGSKGSSNHVAFNQYTITPTIRNKKRE